MGNRIPDSMMEGRKISWENMASFAWLFTHSPRAHPHSETLQKEKPQANRSIEAGFWEVKRRKQRER